MAGNLKGNISAKGKGFDGNPQNINKGGAPKTKLLKDVLTADLQTQSNGVDKLTAIIKRLTTMAVNGNLNAIKEVLDRYDGKATQNVNANLSGDFNVTWNEEKSYETKPKTD